MSLQRHLKRKQARVDNTELLEHIRRAEAEFAQLRNQVEMLSLMLGWNHAMHAYDCRGGTFHVRLTGSPLFAYADALEATISARAYQLGVAK